VTERDDALIAATLSRYKVNITLSASFLRFKLAENSDLQERWVFLLQGAWQPQNEVVRIHRTRRRCREQVQLDKLVAWMQEFREFIERTGRRIEKWIPKTVSLNPSSATEC